MLLITAIRDYLSAMYKAKKQKPSLVFQLQILHLPTSAQKIDLSPPACHFFFLFLLSCQFLQIFYTSFSTAVHHNLIYKIKLSIFFLIFFQSPACFISLASSVQNTVFSAKALSNADTLPASLFTVAADAVGADTALLDAERKLCNSFTP